MKQVVVAGYASMDLSMDVAAFEGVGRTTLVKRRPSTMEPGGIARFFPGLVKHRVRANSWVGSDESSRQWVEALKTNAIDVGGVYALAGRMPTSFLFHAGEGGSMCFFDQGVADPNEMRLAATDEEFIASADLVLIAVGPRQVSERILQILGAGTRLVWVVKADPVAFPVELRAALAMRADVILHSHQEDAFLAEGASHAPSALFVRTAGDRPVEWRQGNEHGTLAVRALEKHVDATGAGDFFAGHFVGQYLAGVDVETALTSAIEATHGFLANRD